MNVVVLFEHAAATFRAVLDEVRTEQHHLLTPCDPLDVSELVARAVGHQHWTRLAIHGEAASRDYPPIEPDQWIAAFDESTAAMVTELHSEAQAAARR